MPDEIQRDWIVRFVELEEGLAGQKRKGRCWKSMSCKEDTTQVEHVVKLVSLISGQNFHKSLFLLRIVPTRIHSKRYSCHFYLQLIISMNYDQRIAVHPGMRSMVPLPRGIGGPVLLRVDAGESCHELPR